MKIAQRKSAPRTQPWDRIPNQACASRRAAPTPFIVAKSSLHAIALAPLLIPL